MDAALIVFIFLGTMIGVVAAALSLAWVVKKRKDFRRPSVSASPFRKIAPKFLLSPYDMKKTPIYRGPPVDFKPIYKLPVRITTTIPDDCVVQLLPGLSLAEEVKV